MSSRFRKLSHTIWHCQYHLIWVPKYRYRILQGSVKEAAESGIRAICGYAGCEVVELNVQPDHLKGALVIMDRGIATRQNIDWVKEGGYRYLVVIPICNQDDTNI